VKWHLFSPALDNIGTMMTVWRMRGKIICAILCSIVYDSCTQWYAHTSSFWATICKTVPLCYQTVVCPVCDVGVLWPNGWADPDETWRAGRPRSWPHCVRWVPSSVPPKGAEPSIFGPYLLWPNGWMDQDATW